MKNCIKGCGNVTEKKHCGSKHCSWWVCLVCAIVFDPEHLNREMKYIGPKKGKKK